MTPLRTLTFGEFLDRVGSRTPAPGGGAVATSAGALAAALARMVVAYSIGRKDLAAHQPALERASEALARMVDLLLRLADEDAEAYALVNELSRLPDGDARRAGELPAAIDAAVQAPRNVVGVCCDLLRLLESLCGTTNQRLKSDLAVAAILGEAAARAAWENVAVNLSLIPDQRRREAVAGEVRPLLDEAAALAARVERACGA